MPEDLPTNKHPDYEEMFNEVQLVMDLLRGSAKMRDSKWLPVMPREDSADYSHRRDTSVLYNAFGATVNKLAAMPFAVPLRFDDGVLSKEQEEWVKSIDRDNTSLHSFAKELVKDLIAYGKAHFLVDMPTNQILNRDRDGRDDKIDDFRPYFMRLGPMTLFNWTIEANGNLRSIFYHRQITRLKGKFTHETVNQVMERLGDRLNFWEEVEIEKSGKKEWRIVNVQPIEREAVSSELPAIPLVEMYVTKKCQLCSKPPLQSLADENLKHFQLRSDMDNVMTLTNFPQRVMSGDTKKAEELQTGPNTVISSPKPDFKYEFAEPSGSSIGVTQAELANIEDRMESLGNRMTEMRPAGNVTATEKSINTAESNSELQDIVTAVEDGIEEGFKLAGYWLNEEIEEVRPKIHQDFGILSTEPQIIGLLTQMNANEQLSDELYLRELQRRNLISADVDLEEELARNARSRTDLTTLTPTPSGD